MLVHGRCAGQERKRKRICRHESYTGRPPNNKSTPKELGLQPARPALQITLLTKSRVICVAEKHSAANQAMPK